MWNRVHNSNEGSTVVPTESGQYLLRTVPGEAIPFRVVQRLGEAVYQSEDFFFPWMWCLSSVEWVGPLQA